MRHTGDRRYQNAKARCDTRLSRLRHLASRRIDHRPQRTADLNDTSAQMRGGQIGCCCDPCHDLVRDFLVGVALQNGDDGGANPATADATNTNLEYLIDGTVINTDRVAVPQSAANCSTTT